MLVFDKSENYWRTFGEERGIPNTDITSMVGDSNFVWVGSYRGIRQIDRKTKREERWVSNIYFIIILLMIYY